MDSVGYGEGEHNYRIEITRFWFFRSWGRLLHRQLQILG